jgi:tetratricopeptide (TPR) repeat protein
METLPVQPARVVIILLLVAGGPAWPAGPDLEKAEALLRANRAQEAYDLLEPYEFDEAGNLKYDYLLGLAALQSGRPDKASLVFERVLALEPRYLGVRLDLGRAYYQMGDLARATQEFQVVLAQNPPPDLKAAAERYMAAIVQAQRPRRFSLLAYVEMGGGYDSNVNSATSTNPILLPGAGNQPFYLDPSSVSEDDTYLTGAVGGEVGYLLTPRWSVFAGADARYRSYHEVDTANYGTLDARAGVGLNLGKNFLRGTGLAGRYFLDDESNRDNYGGNLEWRYQPGAQDQYSVSATYVRYRYIPEEQQINDFDLSLVGLGWLHVFGNGRTLISLNANVGYEGDTQGRPDGPAWLTGGRVFVQTAVTPSLGAFATLGSQRTQYQDVNETFQVTREDWIVDATLGLNWQFARGWSLRPQVQLTHNNSNIETDEFKRADLSLNLRKDFTYP